MKSALSSILALRPRTLPRNRSSRAVPSVGEPPRESPASGREGDTTGPNDPSPSLIFRAAAGRRIQKKRWRLPQAAQGTTANR